MNKNVVKYKNGNVQNCMNNNQTECFICSDNENKLVLVENNICDCYKYIIFCKLCFINWVFKNHKCLICRKLYIYSNKQILDKFNILEKDIYNTILCELKKIRINIPIDNQVIERNHIINNKFENYCLVTIAAYMFLYISYWILYALSLFDIREIKT
jgi:hypothetical protein